MGSDVVKLDIQECARLYASGWSAKQLGEKYGCSDKTVRKRLLKAGFETKPKGRPRTRCRYICMAMYEAGIGVEEVAETFNESVENVRRWLDELGIKPRQARTVELDVETCAQMYESGRTLTEIGNALGCSYMTVRRRLADAGVEIRKVGSRCKQRHRSHCHHVCLAMHEVGLTDDQIAETFGINRSTVAKWIRSFGIKRVRGFASNKDMAGVLAKSNASRSRNATKRFVEKFESLHGDRFEIVECGTCNSKGGTCRLRCKTCGHEFDRYVCFKYKTTCPVCRDAELRRKAEERNAIKAEAEEQRKAANLKVDRTCRECGSTFHSEYEGAAYCSPECKKKHKRRAASGSNASCGGKYRHRRRARKYGCAYDPSVTLARLIERDGLTCYICGKQCDPNDLSWGTSGPDRPTLDHVVPLAKGGGHVWGNVKVCCGECNSAKRDLDVAEVLATA